MKKYSNEEHISRIHTAAISLIESRQLMKVSIYDVAREAAIAPSIIYRYYPNIEALIFKLITEEMQYFDSVLKNAVRPEQVQCWQDIHRMIEQGFIDYYRLNPIVQKALLGNHSYMSIYQADAQNDLKLSKVVEQVYRQYFELPELPQTVNVFAISMQIADKVCSLSFQDTGGISASMARESIRITEAYLAHYIPSVLPINSTHPALN